MSAYEDKIEARRARFAERAERKRAEAAAAAASASRIADAIPFGQPILVGHHSEKRHRRDVERIHSGMRKSIEASEQAARLEDKAENYGTHSISSDDPGAAAKLEAELVGLESAQQTMKAANAAIRKHAAAGADAQLAALVALGLSEKNARSALEPDFAGRLGFPGYALTNNSANIRRVKARIAELQAAAARPEAEPIVGDGFRIEEDSADNRIRFYFDTRPSTEVCQQMKAAGFRWSPTAGAWQRQLNNAGIHAARRMAKAIFGADIAPTS